MKLTFQGQSASALLVVGSTEILFSFGEPVAGYKPSVGYFRTINKYCSATARHINNYLPSSPTKINIVSPDWIGELLQENWLC